jgi:MscS family membrane protein
MVSFLELAQQGSYRRAARFLNLGRGSDRKSVTEGAELAEDLALILSRDSQFDAAALSKDPAGNLSDGLPANLERLASFNAFGRRVELQLEKVQRESGVAVWVVSQASVGLIPELAQATSDSALEKSLPRVLVAVKILHTPIWRWLALGLLVMVVVAASRAIIRLSLLALRPITKRAGLVHADEMFEMLAWPLRLLLLVAMVRAGLEWVGPPAMAIRYIERGLVLITFASLAWLAMRVTEMAGDHLKKKLEAHHPSFTRSGLPLASRIVRVLIVVLTVTAILGAWGYNTSTIMAGLGIGGVAMALAAQKTIENLFGGVAVISDRPVAVGDFCKFGDRVGTVEDIGVRSTRIRTLDRTLVTVPNAEFSAMVLENYSRRDKVWFHPTVSLRRDSTPEQVRMVLTSLERMLAEHPKVEVGSMPVRFVGIGSYSLDIEIFAYILTKDFDEFLGVQQELLLIIVDAVSAAGTALALPTQANVSYFDNVPTESAQPRRQLSRVPGD